MSKSVRLPWWPGYASRGIVALQRRGPVIGTMRLLSIENARAAGWGYLRRGRRKERLDLVELPLGERAPVLREFPRVGPHGVGFFVRAGIVASPSPEAFAEAAPRCAVFAVVSTERERR